MPVKAITVPLVVLNFIMFGSGIQQTCDMNRIPKMSNFSPKETEGVWYPTHEFRARPSYYAGVQGVRYTNTYEEVADRTRSTLRPVIVTRVSLVFQDGSCGDYYAEFSVENGSLSTAAVVMNDGTLRQDVWTVLHTDYQTVLLLMYETFKNGTLEETSTNLGLMVRDPCQEVNATALAQALEPFCGLDATSTMRHFTPLAFDWGAYCSAGGNDTVDATTIA